MRYVRWLVSLALLFGVWMETGWWTTIAIALGMAATEIQVQLWLGLADDDSREITIRRIRNL